MLREIETNDLVSAIHFLDDGDLAYGRSKHDVRNRDAPAAHGSVRGYCRGTGLLYIGRKWRCTRTAHRRFGNHYLLEPVGRSLYQGRLSEGHRGLREDAPQYSC